MKALRAAHPMTRRTGSLSRAHVERVIGLGRVALAASSLFAIWLDPTEPGRFAGLTYTLHGIYLGYALVLAGVMWHRDSRGRVPVVTHWTDVIVASVFQYLTLGPSSPFFTYFTFALFCAALRWGWRETARTALCVLGAYVLMGAWLSRTLGPTEFEMNRFIGRIAYLSVAAVLLVYLGQHEERLRNEIRKLARWPLRSAGDATADITHVIAHAARVLGAGRATIVWNADDEPWLYVAAWQAPDDAGAGETEVPASTSPIERLAPGECEPIVADALTDAAFICPAVDRPDAVVDVTRDGALALWRGQPLHPGLRARLGGSDVASAAFQTENVSGRVFFSDLPALCADVLPLVEVLGREIGASFDQIYSHQRLRSLAITEERINLARDLHDGVLQSLTGIRLDLQTLANATDDRSPARTRLLAIERAMALEQRELRRFIDGLKPSPIIRPDSAPLAERLDDLRRRIELEWGVPVSIGVQPADLMVGERFDRAIPLMVHEAVVNALKHGRPSRVAVEIHGVDGGLRITVTDDGAGFAFSGRRDHAAVMASAGGPVSLKERVTGLGGRIEIESGQGGSRINLFLPVRTAHG